MAHPGTLETSHKSCSFANVWPIAFQSAEAEVESVTPLAKADMGSDIYYQFKGYPKKRVWNRKAEWNKNRQKQVTIFVLMFDA